jgi:hypothetical protein
MSGIKSIPMRSYRPNIPVFGKPSGLPMTASASSTEMPRRSASTSPAVIQYTPIRFARKPGVSFAGTTPLPNTRSAKSQNAAKRSAAKLGALATSNKRMKRGGLKKWVIRKSSWNCCGNPSISTCRGKVEVFDETMEPFLRTASILRYTSCFTSSRSSTTSTIQSHSASLSRSSSRLPGVTRLAKYLWAKPGVPPLSCFSIAASASELRPPSLGTISSKYTGIPAFANTAAIPDPITPDPRTATFLISVTMRTPQRAKG